MKIVIYKAQNKFSGKTYIGQTSSKLEHRIQSYSKGGGYFSNSLRKHGVENFQVDSIGLCYDKEHSDFLEKFYIKFYNSKYPNGYNLTDGGDGVLGYRHTVESKVKMSNSHKGEKNPFLVKAILKKQESR